MGAAAFPLEAQASFPGWWTQQGLQRVWEREALGTAAWLLLAPWSSFSLWPSGAGAISVAHPPW